MHHYWIKAALLGTALLAGGCSFTDNALLPALGGSSSSSGTTATPASATTASTSGAPQLGTGNFQPEPVTPGQPTGTAVGQKIEGMRGDLTKLNASVAAQNQTLQSLRAQTIQNAITYHTAVSAINAKLEVGTTPGNPILVKQWNDAQGKLNAMNDTLSGMNKLANDVAGNASLANYLLESTRATFGISGAVDEDHAQLRVLEDEVNKTTILIDRLLSELTEDITRQTNYLSEERANLNTLAIGVNNGEAFGNSLASREYAPQMQPAYAPGSGIASGRPLVVIRFDRPNVNYEQALYQAASKALEVRSNAAFDVVGVAPSGGTPAQVALNTDIARTNADRVVRSLLSMGLPADRVSTSQSTDPAIQANEVRIYVR